MTALRRSAITELEKLPEDKLPFVIQIMQGVNGLYSDTKSEKKEAFKKVGAVMQKRNCDRRQGRISFLQG